MSAAVEQDVDEFGLSIHSGAHKLLFGKFSGLSKGVNKILVFWGGITRGDDTKNLREQEIIEVFDPETSTDDILWRIQNEILEERRGRN